MTTLRDFREGLQAVMGGDHTARPFVCDGDPRMCQVFVVGINPATTLPFWPYWNDETGFDLKTWRAAYLEARRQKPLKPGKRFRPAVSPTRLRLEALAAAAAPIGVLETNLYAKPAAAAKGLQPEDRDTRVFEYLLSAIRPRVLVLHGKDVRLAVNSLCSAKLSPEFAQVTVLGRAVLAAAVPHFSRGWKLEKAAAIGRQVRTLCEIES